ncbi:hypothetical protein MY04_1403 [Flammeovirga sp. MY04]|uniref:hypothetical protein n=1 Tax=Flammeovirga sp. MY04 TaxID=1191459 RepID=UPI0008063AC6|nr:hypothetical protein [Flammeovirga sp. MY04]ANQ48779.1 hypothetical protein MY04_1403 [Flammeovirga sp. MY04]
MEKFEKKIEISYINYISSNSKRPNNINELIKSQEIEVDDSINLTNYSLITLENNIWNNTIHKAYHNASTDPNFGEYSIREKLLSFFFNYTVCLNQYDKFFTFSSNIHSLFELKEINDRRENIVDTISPYFNQLIQEGLSSGEIEDRVFVQDYYINVMLTQFFLITKYWTEDSSNEKENTDEAVEKSVHLIMDLIGPNFADSAFQLAKFIFQK